MGLSFSVKLHLYLTGKTLIHYGYFFFISGHVAIVTTQHLVTLQITSHALGVYIALLFTCQLHESLIKLYFKQFSIFQLKIYLDLHGSPSFGPQKTITTWLTKTEIFTLHWINIIIRNNKCIFTKLNAVF
jgi:hypothetical protein